MRAAAAALLAGFAAVLAALPGGQLASSATALCLLALVVAGYLLPRPAAALPRTLAIALLAAWGGIATASDRVPELGWAAAVTALGPALGLLALTLDLLDLRQRSGAPPRLVVSRAARILTGCGLAALLALHVAAWAAEAFAGSWNPITVPLAELLLWIPAAPALVRWGTRARATRGLRWAAPAVAAGALALASAAVLELRDPGEIAPTRYGFALDLFVDLERHYPHWSSATDAAELWSRHRRRLRETDLGCGAGECPEFFHILRDVLAELGNGHTQVDCGDAVSWPAITVERIEGRPTITVVDAGSDAEALGLEPGDRIAAVDGIAVESALRAIPPWRVASASPRGRDVLAHVELLAGPPRSRVEVDVEQVDGRARRVSLVREAAPVRDEAPEDDAESEVRTSTEEDGIALIAVDGFLGRRLVRRFDRALDDHLEAPGLVVDLRDNPGGWVHNALMVAGRIVRRDGWLGETCAPHAFEDEEPVVLCEGVRPYRRLRPYSGPVAVLIDEYSASAAEVAAYLLCRAGPARCFGRTTAGESDVVSRRTFDGVVVRFSTADFRPAIGPRIYGHGVVPQEPVERTVADLRLGRDPDLERALAWLRERVATSRAAGATEGSGTR